MKKMIRFVVLLLASVLFMQFAWFIGNSAEHKNTVNAENVNLALRRTAHLLLKENGDSTSQIPPVQQIDNTTWIIKINQPFDYETLPQLLQNSLNIQKITVNYNVAIVDCNDGTLLLGYNFQDYFQNKNLACGERVSDANNCRNIKVSFVNDVATVPKFPLLGWFFATFLAIALYYLGQKFVQRTIIKETAEIIPPNNTFVSFAQSRFDLSNQTLICGGITHTLTYREAKLLNLFVLHQNQVLERSFILENVWADEGILVGRSIDMFVSRLRKLLRNDERIQLLAVHGVGYKMEVN